MLKFLCEFDFDSEYSWKIVAKNVKLNNKIPY
jgi:hypothetical protein